MNLTKYFTSILFSKVLKNQSPLIRVLSLVFFVYEIKYGTKFNKILLLYSVVATLMFYGMIPKELSPLGIVKALPKL